MSTLGIFLIAFAIIILASAVEAAGKRIAAAVTNKEP